MSHSHGSLVAIPGEDIEIGGRRAYASAHVAWHDKPGPDDVLLQDALDRARQAPAHRTDTRFIPFTALAVLQDGFSVLVHVEADAVEAALVKARLAAGECSSQALALETRCDTEDEELRQVKWESAVAFAGANLRDLRLWAGRHDDIPSCPPLAVL